MPSQPQTQTRRSNHAAHPSLKVCENALSQAKRGVKKSRKSARDAARAQEAAFLEEDLANAQAEGQRAPSPSEWDADAILKQHRLRKRKVVASDEEDGQSETELSDFDESEPDVPLAQGGQRSQPATFQVASVTPLSSQLPPRRRRYPASSMPQPSQPRPLPMSANSQDRRFITDNALVPRSQQPMVRLPSPGLSGEEGDEDEDLRSSSVTPPPSTPPSSPPPQSQTTWTALWHTEGFDMSNPRLADLRPSYQAVTAYGCEVLKVLIATKNTFPNDIEANALIREAFYPAC
ncbi:hypothetical protein NLI96_g12520 [Meripilus lineatus]|uniref:Uncharacterized protein n=1 Tax=Meripilus lineatus TaxID=2056292 RepID=A0AAD5UR39_9APHY|nr:hypothetical protein NLI96_g12520 [Physisporinus lineatus]